MIYKPKANGLKKLRLLTNAAFFILALSCTYSPLTLRGAHADESAGSSAYRVGDYDRPTYHRWKAHWKGALGGASYAEGKDEGASAFLHFDTRFEYPLLRWLEVLAEPSVDLYSSRLQERYDNGEYSNKIRPNNFYISAKPNSYLEVRAGALSQSVLKNPILISKRRAFPGFQERATLPVGNFQLQAIAQQLVPTSYTLNTEREGKEALPSFQTQTLEFSGELPAGDFSLMAGHYAYAHLPDKVAAEASIIGNSANGAEAVPGSRFPFGFDGYYGGATACVCNLGPIGFELGYLAEQNRSAPNQFGRGQTWEAGPRWRLGERLIELKYTNHFIESDATVANYLPRWQSGTNRVGDGLEFRYTLEDHHWIFKANWINNRTIVENDHQFTFNSYWLSVETAYAPF